MRLLYKVTRILPQSRKVIDELSCAIIKRDTICTGKSVYRRTTLSGLVCEKFILTDNDCCKHIVEILKEYSIKNVSLTLYIYKNTVNLEVKIFDNFTLGLITLKNYEQEIQKHFLKNPLLFFVCKILFYSLVPILHTVIWDLTKIKKPLPSIV